MVSVVSAVAALDALGIDDVENVLFWAGPLMVDLSCVLCRLIGSSRCPPWEVLGDVGGTRSSLRCTSGTTGSS